MKQYSLLLLFTLLLLSCNTEEFPTPYAAMPDNYLGKWTPESADGLCDRYIEFADGQCYTYICPVQQEFINGRIFYNISFSLLDSRFCHLNGDNPPHLIVGNKDMGTILMLQESGQDILVLNQIRYRRVIGLSRESGRNFGRVVIPDSLKTHFMAIDTRYPLTCSLYVEGTNTPIDPQEAERYLAWISLDESIAIVSENGMVFAKSPGEVTIKVVTQDCRCSDACTIIVGGGNLSEKGPANCYIVPSPGKYWFTPTMGNRRESIGDDIVSVYLSWETFNLYSEFPNNTSNEHVIIPDSVELLPDGTIAFEVPSPMRNGNALIKACDKDDNVIWSWHIWVCQNYNPSRQAQVYANNAGVVMDRNLGALSTEPGNILTMGLLYQWGRKDPFPGAGGQATPAAQSTRLLEARVGAERERLPVFQKSSCSIQESIKRPTYFYYDYNNREGHNWCTENNDACWGDTKTVYDPCPAGWKVLSTSVFNNAVPKQELIDRQCIALRYLPHYALNGSPLTATSSKIVFPLTASLIYPFTDGSNTGSTGAEYAWYMEDAQGGCMSAIWCNKSVEGQPGCAEIIRLSFDKVATSFSDDKSCFYWADRKPQNHPQSFKDVGNAVRCMME